MNGRLILVSIVLESSVFAFSAASFSRCRANASLDKSIPWSFLNSLSSQLIIFWSKSFPPKCDSPPVANTSTTSGDILRTVTSKVPPPKS